MLKLNHAALSRQIVAEQEQSARDLDWVRDLTRKFKQSVKFQVRKAGCHSWADSAYIFHRTVGTAVVATGQIDGLAGIWFAS
jgi:hypothetical protein